MRMRSLNAFASALNQLGCQKQKPILHVAAGETAIPGSSPSVVTSADFKTMQWRQRPPATHNSQLKGRPFFLPWTLAFEGPMHVQMLYTPQYSTPTPLT